jgi:hypothetical protein
MLKGVLILVSLVAAIACGYLVGSVANDFNTAHCYDSVIAHIRQRAENAIKIGPTELPRFQSFMKSLPLVGYETSCPEVRAVLTEQVSK